MSDSLSLILDDGSESFTYSGGIWNNVVTAQYYMGASGYPAFATGSIFLGSFSLTFEGTSVAFIGTTAPVGHSQSATFSIDGGTPAIFPYGGYPWNYQQWYKSPTLPDGFHIIHVENLAMTALDFAVVTAGPNTPLSGKIVIVDDGNADIAFSGEWMESADGFQSGIETVPSGVPFGNSTHRSSHVGDSVKFRFTGSSVSVYGIFDWSIVGNLSATYTLDGNPTSQSYPVTTSSPEFKANAKEAANFPFFSSENLSGAGHTLVINITQCISQEFVLDYITYTPSFSTLAGIPVSSPPPGSSGTISSTVPSSVSTTSDSSTRSKDVPIGSALPSAATPASTKDIPVGPIVGAIAGALLLICVLVLLFILRRRHAKKRFATESVTAFIPNDINDLHSMEEHRRVRRQGSKHVTVLTVRNAVSLVLPPSYEEIAS